VLLLIVALWSVMTAATAWANSAWALFAVRFVFGLGEAGVFASATRVAALVSQAGAVPMDVAGLWSGTVAAI